jgi:hypothetical protein
MPVAYAAITCPTGTAGALPGRWAATRISPLHNALNGFFNLPT